MIDGEAAAKVEAIRRDPWVLWARRCLGLIGVMYLLLGVGASVYFSLLPELDGASAPPRWLGVLLGLFTLALSAGFGLVNFVVAWGLGQGGRWPWIAAMVLGGIYAPSICLPFGALILYALLRDSVRTLYWD